MVGIVHNSSKAVQCSKWTGPGVAIVRNETEFVVCEVILLIDGLLHTEYISPDGNLRKSCTYVLLHGLISNITLKENIRIIETRIFEEVALIRGHMRNGLTEIASEIECCSLICLL